MLSSVIFCRCFTHFFLFSYTIGLLKLFLTHINQSICQRTNGCISILNTAVEVMRDSRLFASVFILYSVVDVPKIRW